MESFHLTVHRRVTAALIAVFDPSHASVTTRSRTVTRSHGRPRAAVSREERRSACQGAICPKCFGIARKGPPGSIALTTFLRDTSPRHARERLPRRRRRKERSFTRVDREKVVEGRAHLVNQISAGN